MSTPSPESNGGSTETIGDATRMENNIACNRNEPRKIQPPVLPVFKGIKYTRKINIIERNNQERAQSKQMVDEINKLKATFGNLAAKFAEKEVNKINMEMEAFDIKDREISKEDSLVNMVFENGDSCESSKLRTQTMNLVKVDLTEIMNWANDDLMRIKSNENLKKLNNTFREKIRELEEVNNNSKKEIRELRIRLATIQRDLDISNNQMRFKTESWEESDTRRRQQIRLRLTGLQTRLATKELTKVNENYTKENQRFEGQIGDHPKGPGHCK